MPKLTGLHRSRVALVLALLAAAGCRDEITTPPGPDARVATLAAVSGGAQRAIAGSPLSEPLVFEALDAAGAPVAGAQVRFSVASGDAALSAPTATTDAQGRASVTVTPGATLGRGALLRVRATVEKPAGAVARDVDFHARREVLVFVRGGQAVVELDRLAQTERILLQGGSYSSAALSPNGVLLAYVDSARVGASTTRAVKVMQLSNGQLLRTHVPPVDRHITPRTRLAWADSNVVAFGYAFGPNGVSPTVGALDVATGAVTDALFQGRNPTVAPDGRVLYDARFVMLTEGGGRYRGERVYLRPAPLAQAGAGGVLRPGPGPFDPQGEYHDIEPSFLGASSVVFVCSDFTAADPHNTLHPSMRLCAMDLSGQNLRLVTSAGPDRRPSVSRDGSTIAFERWGATGADIYFVPAAGGAAVAMAGNTAASEERPEFGLVGWNAPPGASAAASASTGAVRQP